MTELLLLQTNQSGPLVPSRLTQALALHAKLGTTPRGTMQGQELRLAVALPLNDQACAGFVLDFAGQGQRVRGTARGPSSSLLTWAFHTLAGSLRCTLKDVEHDGIVAVAPDQHRGLALAYLADYEDEVRAHRRNENDEDDGASFLGWLAREEHLAVVKGATLGRTLPLDDAAALYEQLLESDEVEDVFVSERELGWLLARFRARRAPR